MEISFNEVEKLFVYRQTDGSLIRRISIGGEFAGAIAGTEHKSRGGITVKVRGRRYWAHRVVWLLNTGHWPVHEIDHINGDKKDNRMSNLRCATRQLNAENMRKPSKRNKVGLLGVSPAGKYHFKAQIGVSGRQIYLGRFKSKEEAHAAYVSAKRIYHKGCTI